MTTFLPNCYDLSIIIVCTVVPATSGHLRFRAKVAPRGRWPPDTDIIMAKIVVGALQKWPTKAGGRSHKGAAVAGTTVLVN